MRARQPSILLSDPTLRDGNHAARHQLTPRQVSAYAAAAEAAGIPIVEVGHGNGLGASSLQVGLSAASDAELLEAARSHLRHSKLGVHVIPGFATIRRDLHAALEIGVDVFRVASHCTESDTTQRHITFLREHREDVHGVLMMSHMVPAATLLQEATKLQSYGATAVILMDSAGAYIPEDVRERVSLLAKELAIPVGFHAHNNLGMAIANSVAAVESGAGIVDGTARGFGAGAGNAQMEVLVAVLTKLGYELDIDLYRALDAAEVAEREFIPTLPAIRSTSIVSGLAGVFSGFAKHVERVAKTFQVDPRDVFFELGRRRVVAGQEDVIIEVAQALAAAAEPEAWRRAG
jgi:4-hydroxy 2-oxovalerate aldolase